VSFCIRIFNFFDNGDIITINAFLLFLKFNAKFNIELNISINFVDEFLKIIKIMETLPEKIEGIPTGEETE